MVGAGSWGTTIARMVGTCHPEVQVTLWARSSALAAAISETRENVRYLPGVTLPPSVRVTSSLHGAVSEAGVVLMAVPSHGFREVLSQMAPALALGAAVVSLAKGVEQGTTLRMSEVIAQVAPGHPAAVLTGPTLAHEVADGHPAAMLVACEDESIAQRVQSLLHSSTLRVYSGTDVIGCEIAGATKNVIAIAVGISDGLGFGDNTRAVLVTRGLAEQARLGLALGGRSLTFVGLAGVGDLVATCTSPQSRNRTVGVQLGLGHALDDVVGGTTMIAEGVRTAGPLVALARSHSVEMPIADQVAALVAGKTTPERALRALMERPPRSEWDEDLVRGIGR